MAEKSKDILQEKGKKKKKKYCDLLDFQQQKLSLIFHLAHRWQCQKAGTGSTLGVAVPVSITITQRSLGGIYSCPETRVLVDVDI